jgi:integrase
MGLKVTSLSEFMTEWMATKVGIRIRTREDYQSIIDKRIIPALGHLRLQQITSPIIQAFCNDLSSNNLSPRTVKYVFDVLRMALQFAVRRGLLHRNPSDLVELPRQRQRQYRVLTVEEAGRFLAAATCDRWYPLWAVLISTGLRPGEALGLQWSDFDAARGELRVHRVLTRSKAAGWAFEAPKTKKSSRTVALPASVVGIVQSHRAQQAKERLAAGPSYQSRDLILATHHGQPLEWRAIAKRHFRPIVKAAGLPPMRPYELRHTFATISMDQGTPLKVVSEALGHSSPTMTLATYQVVLPHMLRASANLLEQTLFGQDVGIDTKQTSAV